MSHIFKETYSVFPLVVQLSQIFYMLWTWYFAVHQGADITVVDLRIFEACLSLSSCKWQVYGTKALGMLSYLISFVSFWLYVRLWDAVMVDSSYFVPAHCSWSVHPSTCTNMPQNSLRNYKTSRVAQIQYRSRYSNCLSVTLSHCPTEHCWSSLAKILSMTPWTTFYYLDILKQAKKCVCMV